MAKFFKFGDVLVNLDNVTSIMKIKRPKNKRKADDNDIEEYEWGLYINYISGSPDRIFPSLGSFEKDIDRYINVIYNSNS